jgi:chromate transporter
LAGYGAAQALPGPLFSVAAYLGASVRPSGSVLGYGLLGLVGIFLPGLLAMAAVLPFWSVLRKSEWVRAVLWGVNASVVGVLLAALIRPLWESSVHGVVDLAVVAAAFAMLVVWKVQPWKVVAGVVLAGMLLRFA